MSTAVNIKFYQGWDKFLKAVFADKDVWVEFINPRHNRCGSIGVVRGATHHRPSSWTKQRELISVITVEFPGTDKPNITITANRWEVGKHIQMLEGYTGGAIRKNEKPKKQPPKAVKDMHDVPIEVGSFCVFNSGNRLVFGSVSSISPTGIVYLNRVNGTPTKILKLSNLAVINEDFRDMMMIRKLAA